MAPNFRSTTPHLITEVDLLYHHDLNEIDHNNNAIPATAIAEQNNDISLTEFIDKLPDVFQQRRFNMNKDGIYNHHIDPIMELFKSVKLERQDWEQYALFDECKNYTRNLIATDHKTFTLLLLCWNPNRESPIHDHPCDGCWMKVLQGSIRECRYQQQEEEQVKCNNNSDDDQKIKTADKNDYTSSSSSSAASTSFLRCTHDEIYHEDQIAFIEDSMGYHKVGNTSHDIPAITMHLYCPPIQSCKIWYNEQCIKPTKVNMCFYSEYGKRI